jgi:DNA-binding CsgD family transcriptional regulator
MSRQAGSPATRVAQPHVDADANAWRSAVLAEVVARVLEAALEAGLGTPLASGRPPSAPSPLADAVVGVESLDARRAQRAATADRWVGDLTERLEALVERMADAAELEERPAGSLRTCPVPPESLSPREVQVLRMLRSECSLPEIADHLYVSYNTVKTHTRMIYRKLEVTGRSAAVRRARQLGYL